MFRHTHSKLQKNNPIYDEIEVDTNINNTSSHTSVCCKNLHTESINLTNYYCYYNSLTDEMQSSEPNSTHQPVIDLASNTQ